MGLFDGFAASRQFGEGGGLLARLRAIQQEQDQYQPGEGFDQPPVAPQLQTLAPTPWPDFSNAGQASVNPQGAASNLTSQYQALLPVLGDHDAMLATVSPDDGKGMIAQAVAGQQPDNNASVVQAGFRIGGVPFPSPFPSPAPVPIPQIPMPHIPDWMKAAGAILQLFRRGGIGTGGGGNDGYRRCLKAAGGSTEDWEEYCRNLGPGQSKTVGANTQNSACWSKTYESEQNKTGWCDNQFGNY